MRLAFANIDAARQALGITAKALYEQASVSASRWGTVKRGEDAFSLEEAERIADALTAFSDRAHRVQRQVEGVAQADPTTEDAVA